jgi:hypothetical protein
MIQVAAGFVARTYLRPSKYQLLISFHRAVVGECRLGSTKVIRESIVCSPACMSLALPQLPEDHISLIISESCLLFSHSFRNSSQSMELVRNTGVGSSPLSGRVRAAVSSHSAAVQAPQRRTSWSIPRVGARRGDHVLVPRDRRSRPRLRRAEARVDT